jgi:RNA polymerase sigma factor (sigma-70 family)
VGFADEFVRDLIQAGAPEDPDPEVLRDLVEQYRYSPPSGPGYPRDPVRDQLILHLAFPVYNLARRFRGRNNADDILGEAMLTLVECVDRWPTVAEDDGIWSYVACSVQRRMKDWIDNDVVLVIPSRRVREKRAAGEEVEQPTLVDINPVEPDHHKDMDPNGRWFDNRNVPRVEHEHTIDIEDFFASRTDPRDRVLVEMRIAGRTADEIAAAVGTKRSWVFKRLRDLERAFAELGDAA